MDTGGSLAPHRKRRPSRRGGRVHALEAAQHGHEDRRRRRGERDLLLQDGLGEHVHVIEREAPRKHHLRAYGRCRERQAPALHMEHGREHHDLVRTRQSAGRADGHGMQPHGAVGQEDALGPPRGARGVAGGRGRGLGHVRDLRQRLRVRDQLLVGGHSREVRELLQGRFGAHHDPPRDLRDVLLEPLGQAQQGVIDDQGRGPAVADHVGQIRRRQAHVQLDHGGAHERDREVGLVVLQAVPQQHAHAGVRADAHPVQGRAHPLDPVPGARVVRGLPLPGVVAVGDLLVSEAASRIAQHPGGGQLLVIAHGGRCSVDQLRLCGHGGTPVV